MPESYDPYHRWLSIPPQEQPPDHYRLLGVQRFESDPEVIRDGADRQMVHVRSYQLGEHSALSQKILNELATARVCLLNADKKAAYDEELRRQQREQTAPLPRAVPVTTTAHVAPAIDAESQAYQHVPKRKPSLPILRAVVGIAGAVILGVLVWQLLSADPPPDLERGPIVAAEPQEAPKPPEPPRSVDKPDDSEEPADEDQPEDPTEVALVDPGEGPSPPSTEDPPEEPEVPAEEPDEPGKSDPPPKPAKLPVPPGDAQEKYRRILDDEYPRPQTPDEKLKLAGELANLAEKAGDPAERFVVLRRASELATEGGDAEKTLVLVARIAEQFEINQLLAEAHVLNQIGTTARGEEQIGALVRSSARVIDDLMAAERFDLANSLSGAVYRATLASGGQAFRVEALERRREVQEQYGLWSKVAEARKVLQQDPDNTEAHTTIAEWYCFVRSDWDRALPHFAKGSNAGLQGLANRELQTPPDDADAQVKLADAWWDLAEKSEEPAEQAFRGRAKHWYEQALPEIASPLVKAKVEMRLEELASVQPPGPQQPPSLAVAPFDARQAAQHQQAWARYLNTPVEITNSIGMKFVLIPPGEFIMGSPESEEGRRSIEGPQHRVRITRPFYLGIYEVTQGQFAQLMDSNASFEGAPTRPVEQVSWHQAVDFCRRVSALPAEHSAGREYRLPTEAEWEYACRAGTITQYSFGHDAGQLGEYAWYGDNSGGRTHSVGQKRPNTWGLYDMHGNVLEWCADWRGYYANSPVEDPRGPASGVRRLRRGGSWSSNATGCRSGYRTWLRPSFRRPTQGFRVALVPAEQPTDRTRKPDTPIERPMPQESAIQEGERPAGSVQPSRPLSDFEKLKRDNPDLFPQNQ